MDVVASKMVAAHDLWLIAAGPGPGPRMSNRSFYIRRQVPVTGDQLQILKQTRRMLRMLRRGRNAWITWLTATQSCQILIQWPCTCLPQMPHSNCSGTR